AGRWVHALRGARGDARRPQRPQASAGRGAGLGVGGAAAAADGRGSAAPQTTHDHMRILTAMLNDKGLEVKTASHADLGAGFDDFMRAFEAFKETNDRRLGEIERCMSADVVTVDKLARI